ncbi:SDR family NAD(P)-dependent oxidoreductase [Fulvivirga sp. M361]|uniref:SDR family oxidoreductase n=1 Tax=Fulvivirga sp. M361 TaxID=2594266 RepID=UPI00117B02A2|nr:SDR family NAD(P)-dependent oxidoreductase [Fulvivirga sp. M361]TRX61429.1 SDR family NAD(P)-dependent oxidoreductase [Fulvivirga sp. M361]
MELSGNKVLITGGSSGIGLAMARRLESMGNHVIITGRNRKKLEAAADRYGLDFYQCDLSVPDQLLALTEAIRDQHSDINMLINNAGLQFNYSFTDEVSFERIQYEVEVNFNVVMKLCAAFVPLLLGTKESAIVNVSSGLALSPKKSAPVYCATKAGVHIFSKALRYQLEGSNVNVFEVLPPLVDTPMTEGRGKDKISTQQLVDEFITAVGKNIYEINIGKVKLLKLMHRVAPAIADHLLKNN